MPEIEQSNSPDSSLVARVVKTLVSIVVLVPVSVVFGYGGWLVLTITATVAGYDPATADGDSLRSRLLAWPDRNRDVMRSNGQAPLPLKP